MKAKRNARQEQALQCYLAASKRYDAHWQAMNNVQLENLRNDLADAYKLMSALVNIRVASGKSEGITAAMRRTYPELLGPDIGAKP
jgi:hypothetical protein